MTQAARQHQTSRNHRGSHTSSSRGGSQTSGRDSSSGRSSSRSSDTSQKSSRSNRSRGRGISMPVKFLGGMPLWIVVGSGVGISALGFVGYRFAKRYLNELGEAGEDSMEGIENEGSEIKDRLQHHFDEDFSENYGV